MDSFEKGLKADCISLEKQLQIDIKRTKVRFRFLWFISALQAKILAGGEHLKIETISEFP